MTRLLAHRLRHPAILIWFLGGIIGSGLNLLVTVALFSLLHVHPLLAFFIGTLANELFHHLFYHVIYINQEIRLRTSLAKQMTMYLIVAALSAGLLSLLMKLTGWLFLPAVIVALLVLAAGNSLVNRLSTFSSAKLAMVEYTAMGESFYDDQTDATKVNWFRAWFHRSRFRRLTQFVDRFYQPGKTVADLGCGNCWWNANGYPVTGVDVNEAMMRWAKSHGRLGDFRLTDDLSKTGLPDGSFDIVIMSEVLEHLLNFEAVMREVRRILKSDGVFLITVPYDFFLGPFFVLFNINCLWQGYVRGSVYHRFRCGHVNHFTRSRLRAALRENGFAVREMSVVNGMSLYAAATAGAAIIAPCESRTP